MIVNFVGIGADPFAFDQEMTWIPRRKDFVKYHGDSYIVTNVAVILQEGSAPFWRVYVKRTNSKD